MKKISVLSFALIGLLAHAQEIGTSPYAAFGIGDQKYDNTVEHSAMGGLTAGYISDFNSSFNFINPAANKNLALTSIRVEGTNESNFYTSDVNDYKGTKHSNFLSNISIAFPVGQKLRMGLGYQPYASRSYNSVVTSDNLTSHFEGTGTINTVQGAVSYQITKEFGLGLRSNFYFGKTNDLREVTLAGAPLLSGDLTSTTIKNFNFTLGAAYQKLFDNDDKFTAGATATFGNIGKSTVAYQRSTYLKDAFNVKTVETILDQRSVDAKDYFPLQASLGAGYGHTNSWFFGAQVNYRKWYDSIYEGRNFQIKDGFRVAAGGWYLPDVNNFRNYFDRVIYRAGLYYDITGLAINGQAVNEMGLTLGASLPIKTTSLNRMTGIDLGIELGKKGTTSANLINQNFINVKIGINFADRWFQRTVYN